MDEVEAALDEPNLLRFLDLISEFRNDAQLIIVSHQKKTMEAADELYGVTMSPGGSSRAIKQRIENPSDSKIKSSNIESSDAEISLALRDRSETSESTESLTIDLTSIDDGDLDSVVDLNAHHREEDRESDDTERAEQVESRTTIADALESSI